MNIFYVLAGPLGYVMQFLYSLVLNYGWTIIIFTVLTRLILFPFSLKQQKSTARMGAYQPMINEIQKKYAKDKEKQNEEIQKFYQENNLSMMPGCMPMLVNMLVIFGVIGVIQAPLKHIIRMPIEQINNGSAIVQTYSKNDKKDQGMESRLIGEIKRNPELFINGMDVYFVTEKKNEKVVVLENGQTFKNGTIYDKAGKAIEENVTVKLVQVEKDWVQKVKDFNFEFLGLNLANIPDGIFSIYAILPLLSILTMFASQIIILKTSGQSQGQKTMLVTTLSMGVFFGWYAFTVPVAFSLYYTVSNIIMLIQQLIVRKFHDPEKIKQEVIQEIEERKKAKKAKKQVTIKDDSGKTVTKNVSDNELATLRLAKAREKSLEKYGDLEEDIKKAKEKLNQDKSKNNQDQ